jgi:hypothetical protein
MLISSAKYIICLTACCGPVAMKYRAMEPVSKAKILLA